MSAQRKMDIRGFFTSVRKSHHLANFQTFADEEKAASEAARKILRREAIAKQNEANRMAARKRRNEAKAAEVVEDKRTKSDKRVYFTNSLYFKSAFLETFSGDRMTS